jgi:hypothetical protein
MLCNNPRKMVSNFNYAYFWAVYWFEIIDISMYHLLWFIVIERSCFSEKSENTYFLGDKNPDIRNEAVAGTICETLVKTRNITHPSFSSPHPKVIFLKNSYHFFIYHITNPYNDDKNIQNIRVTQS